jgi:PAS domain S-box-containing protein
MNENNLSGNMQNQLEQQAFIAKLGQIALGADSLETLLETTVSQVRKILKADYCKVLEYYPQSQSLLLRAGEGWQAGLVGNAQVEAGLDSQAGYTLISDAPVVVDDLSQEQRFHGPKLLLDHEVKSGISVVIRGIQHPYGVLGVHSREIRKFKPYDADFVQAIANILAGFIERSSVEDSLRNLNLSLGTQVDERTRMLRLLLDVTVRVNESESVDEAIIVVLDTIRSFTGWQAGHALFTIEDDHQNQLVDDHSLLTPNPIWSLDDSRDYTGITEARKYITFEDGDCLAGAALQNNAPILVEDISQQSVVGKERLLDAGLRSALAIPIVKATEVVLVIEFFFKDTAGMTTEFLEVLAYAGVKLGREIERRQAEEQLRESESRLIEAQRIARVGSWEWDVTKDKVSWSPELLHIFDIGAGEFEGTYQAFLDRVHPDDLELVRTEIQKAYETGNPYYFRHRIITSNGKQLILQAHGKVLLDEKNQPVKMVGTAQDISQIVAIENRLREQDKLLDRVLAQSGIDLWALDGKGNLRLSRRRGLAALGIPAGQLGANVFDLLPESDPLVQHLHQAMDGVEVEVDLKVGEHTYDLHLLPQLDQQNNITGVNGIAFDITRRLKTEQALRKSEQNYRQVIESVREYAIFSLDIDGHVMTWNEGAKRVMGYRAEEILGKHFSVFFIPADREQGLPQRATRIVLDKGKYEAEGWRMRKDGTHFWANTLLTPIYDDDGKLQGLTKIVRDFTDRRNADQAIRESEIKFRSIFEFGAMGIALLDLKGRFLLTNPPLQRILGLGIQEMLSQSLESLAYQIDSPSLIDMYAEIASGNHNLFRRETRFHKKDGQIVWVSLTFSLVRDENSSPAYVISMFEDITYRKRMEAEIQVIKRQLIISQEEQKLRLAQELHDDPMQELYGALFQLETMDDSIPKDEMQSQIDLTKRSVEQVIYKLRVICGQLRPLSLAPFGLEGAIREHMDKFQEEHPQLNVKLELTYDGQLLSDEIRISLFRIYQQALGNVIRHAQATTVIVRFYYDDQEVTLDVEDDGVGFEVPFSWLDLARKEHLGLAGSAERAELLGGKLIIQSKPGKGTLVRSVIPLKPSEDPAISVFTDPEIYKTHKV